MTRSFLARSRPLWPLLRGPLWPCLLLAIGAGCSDDTAPHQGDGGSIVEVGGADGTGNSGSGGSSGGVGGSSGSNGGVPLLRGPVSLGDDALARQALGLLGAPAVNGTGNCKNCHSLGRPTLSHWSQLTQAFTTACLKDPALSDQDAVDALYECFQSQASGGQLGQMRKTQLA